MDLLTIYRPHDILKAHGFRSVVRRIVQNEANQSRCHVSDLLVSKYLNFGNPGRMLPPWDAADVGNKSKQQYLEEVYRFLGSKALYKPPSNVFTPVDCDVLVVSADAPIFGFNGVALGVVVKKQAFFVSTAGGFVTESV